MKLFRVLLKIVLPLLVLSVGAMGLRTLVMGRQPPKKEARVTPGPLVEVLPVAKQDRPVVVHATGTVQASRGVDITPQVTGTVVEMASGLVVGGFIEEGTVLFAVEPADYELALERARAALVGARYELTKVESQAEIARSEWERLEIEEAPPNPLVLHGPQLDNARANVASARAAVRQAEINLARTSIRAPFNARVHSEQIEVGQYVRAGTMVATLVGTDRAEVVVPLPLEELRWVTIPQGGPTQRGSAATIALAAGDRTYEWRGRIGRSLGAVDSRGRMTRVVIEIDDPYGLRGKSRDRPGLEVGMFVDVVIAGGTISDVFVLPRSALRDDATVWVADDEDRLRIRPVEIVRLERQDALLREGIEEGARVITTAVSGAADGMKLRPLASDSGEQLR